MRGSRVSFVMGKYLGDKKTLMSSNLNPHHYNIFSVDTTGNASHVGGEEEFKTMKVSNSTKISGLSRLRRKRLLNSSNKIKGGLCRNGLDMMTSNDREYLRGNISDAALMPRSVGMLPYAEHYGSLS